MKNKLRINKLFGNCQLSIVNYTLLFLIITNVSLAQKKGKEKEIDNGKSKKTIVEDGKKFYLHTVDKKQTLFAIAKIYNLSVNDIVLENPDAIDGIKPGQVLKVPFEKPKTKETVRKPTEEKTKPTEKEKEKKPEVIADDNANYILDTVEKGQTLYSFSKQYGISVDKIKELNPETEEGLKIGQVLRFPNDNKKPAISKKEKSKEKRVKEKAEKEVPTANKVVVPEPLPPLTIKDTIVTAVFTPVLKTEYNIAFFLPFHADEASELDVEKLIKGEEHLPSKTDIALSFFEGSMIAIDSLKKQKLNAKIFVYDIDDKDSVGIEKILAKPELSKMDLMIGPLYGSGFMPVSKFAKEHGIPIISPFIQMNKILFSNPYVCKVIPSTTLQVERIAHFVVDSFSTQNIILVDNAKTRESAFLGAFKSTANAGLIEKGLPPADSVKQAKGLTGVEAMLQENKTNVVVLPSLDQAYVTEFVRGLRSKHEKYKIVLFGLQNWTNFDNLDFEYLNDLSLHIASNTYVDYQNPATEEVIRTYRMKYKTEPDLYAYEGFDISYYFLSSLKKNGTGFLKTISDNKFQGVETNFNFQQHPEDSGFENRFVHILKFQEYKLVRAN